MDFEGVCSCLPGCCSLTSGVVTEDHVTMCLVHLQNKIPRLVGPSNVSVQCLCTLHGAGWYMTAFFGAAMWLHAPPCLLHEAA